MIKFLIVVYGEVKGKWCSNTIQESERRTMTGDVRSVYDRLLDAKEVCDRNPQSCGGILDNCGLGKDFILCNRPPNETSSDCGSVIFKKVAGALVGNQNYSNYIDSLGQISLIMSNMVYRN